MASNSQEPPVVGSCLVDDGVDALQDVSGAIGRLRRRGYVVLPEMVDPGLITQIRSELDPLLQAGPRGRNVFEGERTNRVYALLAKAPTVAALVEHPTVIAMLDGLLLPNYLLSANLAINLLPGESRQPWHYDDSFYPLVRPRPPVSISTIWAIDRFHCTNGATEVLEGSHLWDDARHPEEDAQGLALEMDAGSVVVFAGTLWHRGGTNSSASPRLGITIQYCEPWARQQEAQMTAVGSAAAGFSRRVQELLGYSIHPPFMGHVDGMHPNRVLGRAEELTA